MVDRITSEDSRFDADGQLHARSMARTVKGESKRIRSRDVPKLIQSAGEGAWEAYRAYFTGIDKDRTRAFHMTASRCFFRWTEGKNLSLDRLSTCDGLSYVEELNRKVARRTLCNYISALRCLFRHLVRAGVLQNNPFAMYRTEYMPPHPEVKVVIRIPLSELERQIREYNASWPKHSRLFQAALVILAPRAIGTTNIVAISEFTGVPVSKAKRISRRLWDNGVWALGGNVRSFGDDLEWRGGTFLRDVYVAAGLWVGKNEV
jgi:Phage integrase, N-terminal SAM-like domain